MRLKVDRVDVWAASMKDEPGSMGRILTGLHEAGADLDFIFARRAPETPGQAVVFVTPLRGDAQIQAASILGFNVSNSVHSVRVEGDNRAGIAAQIAGKLAGAKVNLRGFSAAVIGERFIVYVSLDTREDAEKAAKVLKGA